MQFFSAVLTHCVHKVNHLARRRFWISHQNDLTWSGFELHNN